MSNQCNVNIFRNNYFNSCCYTRVVFEGFERENERMKSNSIRSHSCITAFFLNCLGKITKVKSSTGEVFYLNKASFNKWKARTQAELKMNSQLPPALNDQINILCASKMEDRANSRLDTIMPQIIDQGADLLDRAAQVDLARKAYFEARGNVNHHLSSEFHNLKDKNESTLWFKQWENVLKETEEELKKNQSPLKPYTNTQDKLNLCRTAFAAVKTANTAHAAITALGKEIDAFLGKEFHAMLSSELTLAAIRDQIQATEKTCGEIERKIKTYDLDGSQAESNSLGTLRENYSHYYLSLLTDRLKEASRNILTTVRDAEHQQYFDLSETRFSEAKAELSASNLEGGLNKMKEAQELSRSVTYDHKVLWLGKLVDWCRNNPEAAKIKDNVSLKTKIASDLTDWDLSLEKIAGEGVPAEAKASVKAIVWHINENLNANLPWYTSLISSPLLKELGIKIEEDKSGLKYIVASLPSHESETVGKPIYKRWNMLIMSQAIVQIKASCDKYLKAQQLNNQAEGELAVKNLNGALAKYEEAAKVAPERHQKEYQDKAETVKKLIAMCKERNIDTKTLAADSATLKEKVQKDLVTWAFEGSQISFSNTQEYRLLEQIREMLHWMGRENYKRVDASFEGLLSHFNIKLAFPSHSNNFGKCLTKQKQDKMLSDLAEELSAHFILRQVSTALTQLQVPVGKYVIATQAAAKASAALQNNDLQRAQNIMSEAVNEVGDGLVELKKNITRQCTDITKLVAAVSVQIDDKELKSLTEANQKMVEQIRSVIIPNPTAPYCETGLRVLHQLRRKFEESVNSSQFVISSDDLSHFHIPYENEPENKELSDLRTTFPVVKKLQLLCEAKSKIYVQKTLSKIGEEIHKVSVKYKGLIEATEKEVVQFNQFMNRYMLESAQHILNQIIEVQGAQVSSIKVHFESSLKGLTALINWRNSLDNQTWEKVKEYAQETETQRHDHLKYEAYQSQIFLQDKVYQLPRETTNYGFVAAQIKVYEAIFTYTKDLTTNARSTATDSILASMRNATCQFVDICGFDLAKWDNQIESLNSIVCNDSTITSCRQAWKHSINVIQTGRLLNSLYNDNDRKLKDHAALNELTKKLDQDKFRQWEEILRRNDLNFKIDNEKLLAQLQKLRSNIIEETKLYQQSKYQKEGSSFVPANSIVNLQNIALLLGRPKPKKPIVENVTDDCELDAVKYQIFLIKVDALAAITDPDKLQVAKLEAVDAFMDVWLLIALKLLVAVPKKVQQTVAAPVKKQKKKVLLYA